MQPIVLWFAVTNLAALFLYGIDKRQAIRHRHRISEKTLILIAVFGGGIGAYFGMHLFRHKTRHRKFTVGVPLCILLNFLTALLLSTEF